MELFLPRNLRGGAFRREKWTLGLWLGYPSLPTVAQLSTVRRRWYEEPREMDEANLYFAFLRF